MIIRAEISFGSLINDYFSKLTINLVIVGLDRVYTIDEILDTEFYQDKIVIELPGRFKDGNINLAKKTKLIFNNENFVDKSAEEVYYLNRKFPVFLFLWKIITPDGEISYTYKGIQKISKFDNIDLG